MLTETMVWLEDLLSRAAGQAEVIALIGLPLLLLKLLQSKGRFREVLLAAAPRGSVTNALAFAVDITVTAAPLAALFSLLLTLRDGPVSRSLAQAWEGLPSWAVAFSAIFLGDAISYFRHRFEHSRLLWPSHSLHHSDEQMTCMTILRFHPINRFTTFAVDFGMLLLMGLPLWAIFANNVVRHVYGTFVHANAPWTLGIFGKVLASPAMHRWHHVREGQGMHSNFATVFSVFDRAFGTYYCPGPCDEPLGVEGVEANAFWQQMAEPFIVPFRKRRLDTATQESASSTKLGSL